VAAAETEEPELKEAPIEKIGKYGGTLKVFASDPAPWQDVQWGAGLSDGLFRMTKGATGPEENLATGCEISDDFTSFTFFLRKGVKWSDGEPLTADDCLFWFNDLLEDPDLKSWSTIGPEVLENAEALDEFTVRLNWIEPRPDIPAQMAQWPSWLMAQPKHFAAKWHPKYNADAEKDTTHKVYERNPYYWKVDTEGNQYPYIDRVLVQIVDSEVYNLKVISGEADYAYIGTNFENFTLYKENEEAGDYRVILMPGPNASETTISLNLTAPDLEYRKIFQDVRFRRAMSLALDREEINSVLYFGKGVPRQATVMPTVSCYREAWGKAWTQHDPAQANRLLDEMGLTKKDKDGFRLLPSGKPIHMPLEYSGDATEEKLLELVKEFWAAVGVKADPKFLEQAFWQDREGTNEHLARNGETPRADELTNYAQGARDFSGRFDHLNGCQLWDRWADAKAAIEDVTEKLKTEKDSEEIAKLESELARQEENLKTAAADLRGEEPPERYMQLREWFD